MELFASRKGEKQRDPESKTMKRRGKWSKNGRFQLAKWKNELQNSITQKKIEETETNKTQPVKAEAVVC